jgi:hypothetical protein
MMDAASREGSGASEWFACKGAAKSSQRNGKGLGKGTGIFSTRSFLR